MRANPKRREKRKSQGLINILAGMRGTGKGAEAGGELPVRKGGSAVDHVPRTDILDGRNQKTRERGQGIRGGRPGHQGGDHGLEEEKEAPGEEKEHRQGMDKMDSPICRSNLQSDSACTNS